MEQKLKFGLVLVQLVVLKKIIGPDYKQLLRSFFFMFSGAKRKEKLKDIVASKLKSCINKAEKKINNVLKI